MYLEESLDLLLLFLRLKVYTKALDVNCIKQIVLTLCGEHASAGYAFMLVGNASRKICRFQQLHLFTAYLALFRRAWLIAINLCMDILLFKTRS